MKKFILGLVIFLIFFAVVFFVGWVQLYIPPNAVAVLHTKLNGYESQIIKSDKFYWRWEKLVPYLLTVNVFPTEPLTQDITNKTLSLPSADVYKKVLQDDIDFTYKIDLSVTYRIIPEFLPTLARDQGLTPENYQDFCSKAFADIESRVTDYILSASAEQNFFTDKASLSALIIKAYREEGLDYVEILSIMIRTITGPDMKLYQLARQTYFDLINKTTQLDVQALEKENTTPYLLRLYGQILTEYPVLVKFLFLKQISGKDLPAVIDEIFKVTP